jgi:protein SCO1/2
MVAAAVGLAPAREAERGERLPRIGPAPNFTLTATNDRAVSLRDLRGAVVVVTFIYTRCADTCPLLTTKLVAVQRALGGDAEGAVAFVAVTVDPRRDTPAVLRQYARRHGADGTGWSFLTGAPAAVRDVTNRYGVYARRAAGGDVDHTFLTSIVDRQGTLRVQYVGVAFDTDEMLGDIRSLLREPDGR